jgi:hypothetical protein
VPILKPAHRQIKTKTGQIHKNKTLNRQNKNNIAEKAIFKEVLGQKSDTLKKHR